MKILKNKKILKKKENFEKKKKILKKYEEKHCCKKWKRGKK